jgi:DNA (cytosine-5)-methyltransferase 1
LLVASPECTHFSKARGGKPMSKQSRASVKYVLRWIGALDVEDVLIENVPDFMTWGPLHRTCICLAGVNIPAKDHDSKCHFEKPIQNRKGEYFHRFINKLKSLGYQVGYRVLTAADYGDPTTRQRLFIIARKHRKIEWPTPSHHKDGGDMFGKRPRWRAAREIIDWSLKGQSIYSRKTPLKPNTMRRIEAGLVKFGGGAFVIGQQSGAVPRSVDDPIPTIAAAGKISFVEPFLVEYHGGPAGNKRTRSVNEPLPTLDTSNRFGLVEPFIIPFFGERDGQTPRTHSINEPLQTITSQGAGALVEPFIIQMDMGGYVRDIDQPFPTLTSADSFALVDPFLVEYYGTGGAASIDEPMKTITGKSRFGLVQPMSIEKDGKRYIMDIRFRMLQPHELAQAMSFPKKYKFKGTREQVVKQIGNSVPVGMAEALCATLLA